MIEQVREMRSEDVEQVLELYHRFATRYVGLARRRKKDYIRLIRKKEYINHVALDKRGEIVGYISSRFEKRKRDGRIDEIVVDTNHDLQKIAKQLVDKAYTTLIEKKSAIIFAGSIRNPSYENIFPAMGFFGTESQDVFMYTVLDTSKFLKEVAPIFVKRLRETKGWSGLLQIECEGHSLFINKDQKDAQVLIWTNLTVDFKVTLTKGLLTKLLLGNMDPVEASQAGQLAIETTENKTTINHLLRALFPKRNFLIMDYW